MDKRGQQLSTTSIILIVLGVLVLVFLIIGFAIGWKKILPWIKPSNNVDQIRQQCELACNTNSKYNFCSVKRELKSDTEKLEDTCYFFSKKRKVYGIEECPGITCGVYDSEDKAKEACESVGEKVPYFTDEGTKEYICTGQDIQSSSPPQAPSAG
jgi:hypothetical protein